MRELLKIERERKVRAEKNARKFILTWDDLDQTNLDNSLLIARLRAREQALKSLRNGKPNQDMKV